MSSIELMLLDLDGLGADCPRPPSHPDQTATGAVVDKVSRLSGLGPEAVRRDRTGAVVE